MYPSTGTIQYADSKFTVLISKATSKYKSHCNASNMHSNVYFYPPYSNSNLNNPPTPQLRDWEWDFKNEDFTHLYLLKMKISQIYTYQAYRLQMQLHLQRNSSSVRMLFCHHQIHYVHQAPARDWRLCQITCSKKGTEKSIDLFLPPHTKKEKL